MAVCNDISCASELITGFLKICDYESNWSSVTSASEMRESRVVELIKILRK